LAIGSRSWPAAILLASELRDASGLELCGSLRSFGYRGPILILRLSEHSAPTVAALDGGADDVIDASADAAEIAARLRAQSRRLLLVTEASEPAAWPLQALPGFEPPRTGSLSRETRNPLTPREQEVLEQMVLGFGNSEIAERLFLSLDTVKTHVRNLMGKLKARHRTQAVILALQSGYCLLPAGDRTASARPNRVGC
jgi:DNA-binding NarL/FixJ family response regulator